MRDNIFTDIVKNLYNFDTNTNVCPSLHVIGSFAVMFTTRQCKPLLKPSLQIPIVVSTVLISISTVFLKQHSVVDIIAALAVCAVAYPFAYILPSRSEETKRKKEKIKRDIPTGKQQSEA